MGMKATDTARIGAETFASCVLPNVKAEGSNAISAALPVKVHMKLGDSEENMQKQQLAERPRCKPFAICSMKVKVILK